MRNVRDSFTAFIREALPDIPVHQIRTTKDGQTPSEPQIGAVNLTFVNLKFSSPGSMVVVIDVLNNDELVAVDITSKVADALRMACYTPMMDYSDPDNPSSVGGRIFWEKTVNFNTVQSFGYYAHLSAKVTLSFQ